MFFSVIYRQKTIKYFVLLKKKKFLYNIKAKNYYVFCTIKKNIFFGRIQKQKTIKYFVLLKKEIFV